MEQEILTKEAKSIRAFHQMLEGIFRKIELYCKHSRPILNGEIYLTREELCERLHLSPRTLQEYRNNVTLPFYKLGGKILYKESDVQKMLQRHYNPIIEQK